MLFMAFGIAAARVSKRFRARATARFTRAAPYQCPHSTWFELAIEQDACHLSEEAERVCHKPATSLAVACKTKALRSFDL
jgi:hypothetical protein